MTLTLRALPGMFAAAKLNTADGVDFGRPYTFFASTGDELSLICEAERVPRGAARVEGGYRGLKAEGPLDFSLVGVMAGLAVALAEAGVSLLAVSTFDTDYVFVKDEKLSEAVAALRKAGYRVILQ